MGPQEALEIAGADADHERDGASVSLQLTRTVLDALARKPETVHERPLLRQPHDPAAAKVRLRVRHDRPGHEVVEAEPAQARSELTVLVEPGRETDRPGQLEAAGGDPQPRVVLDVA